MKNQKLNRALCSLLVWLLCVSSMVFPVFGAEPSEVAPMQLPPQKQEIEDGVRITWKALKALVDRHPLVVAGRHTREASQALEASAKAAPNPELEATWALGHGVDTDESRFEWGISLSMPLDWIVQRKANVAAVRAGTVVAEAETAVVRRDVLFQLSALFWKVVESQERVSALDEIYRQTDALLKTVRRRVEMGEVRPVEAVRISVEADRIAAKLDVAHRSLWGHRARLEAWLDGRAERAIVAVADLGQIPSPLSIQEVNAALGAEHPAMAVEDARMEALTAEVETAKRKRMPSLSVGVFTDHELDRRAYGGGLQVELPLWNWNRGAINHQESLVAAAQKKRDAALLGLQDAAIEAQTACEEGVALATSYQDKIVPAAEGAAQTIEKTYELGEATLLEVIDARRTLVEIKRAFLDALVKAQTDCTKLRLFVGREER